MESSELSRLEMAKYQIWLDGRPHVLHNSGEVLEVDRASIKCGICAIELKLNVGVRAIATNFYKNSLFFRTVVLY